MAKSSKPNVEINAKISGVEDMKQWCSNKKHYSSSSQHGTSGALYFVGFIGALVYWMQAAVGFGAVVTGFLKAMVWPAYVVFQLLQTFYGAVN